VVELKEGASTIEWLRRTSRPLGTVFAEGGDAVVASEGAGLIASRWR